MKNIIYNSNKNKYNNINNTKIIITIKTNITIIEIKINVIVK